MNRSQLRIPHPKLLQPKGKEIHCSVLYMMNGHEIKADMHAKKVKGKCKTDSTNNTMKCKV